MTTYNLQYPARLEKYCHIRLSCNTKLNDNSISTELLSDHLTDDDGELWSNTELVQRHILDDIIYDAIIIDRIMANRWNAGSGFVIIGVVDYLINRNLDLTPWLDDIEMAYNIEMRYAYTISREKDKRAREDVLNGFIHKIRYLYKDR